MIGTKYCSFAILRLIPMIPSNLWRGQIQNKEQCVLRVCVNIIWFFSVQGTIVWLWLPCLRLKSMLPPTVAVKLRLCSISRSLAGHDGMCLVGVCNFQARRVFISRDPAIPPKTEILGPLSPRVGWSPVFNSSEQWRCFSCENQDGHRWPGFASLSWPMAVKVRCGLLFLVIH